MGYNYYITRRAKVNEPDSGPFISLKDFQDAVEQDPRCSLDEDETCATFTGQPVTTAPNANEICLEWNEDGDIVFRVGVEQHIYEIVQFAKLLDARVVGDGGEDYDIFSINSIHKPTPVKIPWHFVLIPVGLTLVGALVRWIMNP